MRTSTIALLLILAAASAATVHADVTVTPPAPGTTDAVTIRLANRFGAEASILSASITQTGNTFTIEQTVRFGCHLPSNPLVASDFTVGPLAPGSYTVIANITFTPSPPDCARPPITQTATFAVSAPPIPALSMSGWWLLAVSMAVAAVTVLKVRSS